MAKFDFNEVKDLPATKAAEQAIADGIEELNSQEKPVIQYPRPAAEPAPAAEAAAEPQAPQQGSKLDNEPTKGVQANLPISLYNRMKRLKFETDETFQSMFQQAMDLYLDVQEGKMKVSKVE